MVHAIGDAYLKWLANNYEVGEPFGGSADIKGLAERMRNDGVKGVTSGRLKDVLDMTVDGHFRAPAPRRGHIVRQTPRGYLWSKPGWDGTTLATNGGYVKSVR